MRKKNTRRTNRSRNTLLLALGLFLIVQLFVDGFVDWRWPLLRFPTAREMFQGLAKRSAGPDILFLGSSRTQGNIQEAEVSSILEWQCRLDRRVGVLNAAVPAGDHLAQAFLLDELLRSGVRPQLVVMEVSPEFLNRSNPFYHYCLVRQLRWDDIPEHLGALMNTSHLGRLAGARFFPFYQHRSQLLEIARNILRTGNASVPLSTPRLKFKPPESRPVDQRPIPWEELLSMQPPSQTPQLIASIHEGANVVRRKWLRNYQVEDVAVKALQRSEEHCRKNGIEVLYFIPPVTVAHRTTYLPEIEAEFQRTIEEIRNRGGYRLVDCRDWLADGWFYDHHHVLPQGGTLFSRLFTQRVLAPWWMEKISNPTVKLSRRNDQ